MELMLINYYQWIFQHLKRWEKPAPQIIHLDFKRTLAAMSERTGMSISQVTDEVLYTGLIEMQELWGGSGRIGAGHMIHKVVSCIAA